MFPSWVKKQTSKMKLIHYWVTPRLAAGDPSNLISLCVLRALRGDISFLLKQIRDCGWFHWPAKPSVPVTCDRFLPIKCSTERFNKDFLAKPVLSKAEGTPRPQRVKSEFRSQKQIMIQIRNPNFEIRNNAKIQITEI